MHYFSIMKHIGRPSTKKKNVTCEVPVVAQQKTITTRNPEFEGSILGLAPCVKDPALL